MKKFLSLMVLAVLTNSAFALEVAFVNMNKLFENYYETKDADEALKTQRDIKAEEASAMLKEFEALGKKYQALMQETENPLLTKEQRASKAAEMKSVEKEAKQMKIDLEKHRQKSLQEVRAKYEEKRDEIIAKLVKYLGKVSKAKKYDLVLDVSGKTANGISGVVYYDEKKDITDVVLKNLNAGHETTEKDAK